MNKFTKYSYYLPIREMKQELAHQLFHFKTRKIRFLTMYHEHMKQCYGYLVTDCTPQYPSKIKICVDVFFSEQLTW